MEMAEAGFKRGWIRLPLEPKLLLINSGTFLDKLKVEKCKRWVPLGQISVPSPFLPSPGTEEHLGET